MRIFFFCLLVCAPLAAQTTNVVDPIAAASAIGNPFANTDRRMALMKQAGLTAVPHPDPETAAYVMGKAIDAEEAAGIYVSDAEYLAYFHACNSP